MDHKIEFQLNPEWLASPERQEVAEAIGKLNAVAARWARANPREYEQAERDFLSAWIDTEGVMVHFTDNYVPPPSFVEPPRRAS